MLAWLRDLTSRERRTMLACWGGWTLDGFDQQLYSYVVPTVIAVWGMSTGAAGTIGTVTVVTSSFGGWFAGALADRFGRVRMLQIAILWYSVFTFLCSFAQNFEQLFVLRGLHGLGSLFKSPGRRFGSRANILRAAFRCQSRRFP